MSSIIEMPELVLENIIGFLDFRAVFTLRQVCRDFRNFINEMKKSKLPDSKFRKIHVFLKNEEMIRLDFIWNSGSQMQIEKKFEKEKPGFFDLISRGMCLKYFGSNKTFSEPDDLDMDRVLEDFKFVLKSQKSILQDFEFELEISQNSIVFSKLVHVLKSLNQKIQTERLRILGTQEFQFLSVLPLIVSKNLEGFLVLPIDPVLNFSINPEIYRTFETEQWKNSTKLYFGLCATGLNLENVRKFSTSGLHYGSITVENMNSFKKILTDSPKFKFFHLTVTHFEETENLINAWGAPYEFEDSQHWFFRTKHSNIQKIECRNGVMFSIWFTSIEIGNIPKGAIIQD